MARNGGRNLPTVATSAMVGDKWGYGLLAKFPVRKTELEEAEKNATEQMLMVAVMAEHAAGRRRCSRRSSSHHWGRLRRL